MVKVIVEQCNKDMSLNDLLKIVSNNGINYIHSRDFWFVVNC